MRIRCNDHNADYELPETIFGGFAAFWHGVHGHLPESMTLTCECGATYTLGPKHAPSIEHGVVPVFLAAVKAKSGFEEFYKAHVTHQMQKAPNTSR